MFSKKIMPEVGAEIATDAIEEIEKEPDANIDTGMEANDGFIDPISLTRTAMTQNNTQTVQSEIGPSTRKKKRRRISGGVEQNQQDNIGETMANAGNVFEDAGKNIAKLVRCFQFMVDNAEQQKSITPELVNLAGLDEN